MTSTFERGSILRSCVVTALGLVALPGCHTETKQPAVVLDEPKTPSEPETMDAASSPCQLVFGASCGATCSNDDPCPPGLHCEGGSCAAECIAKNDCKKGDCSPDGQCVESDGIFLDPAMTDPTDTSLPPVCIEGQVEFKAVVPQVWLLLDRSGSMQDALVSGTTRWAALGNVLFG